MNIFFHDVSFKLAHVTMSKTAGRVYIKSLSKYFFFSLGCHLCRKENNQKDCLFPILPSLSFSLLPSSRSFLLISLFFPSLFSYLLSPLKYFKVTLVIIHSRVRNASRLNLHSAFNSCQDFTCIYQKWNVLLYIMLNQLEVKGLNHCIHKSKMLCFPIAFTLGGSHFQLPKWPSNLILTTL